MGIDIREGQQLECITCALCIDACDDVMARIGKPRGLIDYMALKDETAERTGAAPKPLMKHVLRPRTLLYFTLWAAIGIGLVVALFMRSPYDLNVSPIRNPQFVTMADGSIRNTYELRLRNKQGADKQFAVGVSDDEGGQLPALSIALEGGAPFVDVNADETYQQRVYLTAQPGSPLAEGAQTPLTIWIEDATDGRRASVETVFHGTGR